MDLSQSWAGYCGVLCIIPHSQDPSDCHYRDSPDYLLGRARNVTPFLWWAPEHRYVWPGWAGCCWLYYASKISRGLRDNILPDNEDNKLLSDTMSEHRWVTHCPHPRTHRYPGAANQSKVSDFRQFWVRSCPDWLPVARARCDWSMMWPWSLVTTRAMNNGPRSLR